jgi:class 3 adenylate cyclase/uncharacterized protein (DUF427 family)
MNVHATSPAKGYQIEIRPLDGKVSVLRNGIVLASSTRAKVMYETRLSPAVYFPPEDVIAPLSQPVPLQTFCPFKGTATYRSLELPGETVPNAVWSYETPLPESREIGGYLGFMPHAFTEIETDNCDLSAPDYGNIGGPVVDWLLRGAASLPTPEAFTKALAEKLVEHGVYLSRLSVMAWSLHPMIAGKNFIWQRKTGEVTTYAPSYEIHDHPAYQNSPLRHVSNGLGGVRQRLDGTASQSSFPIIEDLRKEGATDYVAMPLPFSDGRTNVLTLTSDHPNGFSTTNLGLIFECSAVIAKYYEVFMQTENARALLETYVGKRSGARVLGGEIRRGDGDEIDAAIMFCDLRGSTRKEETMGREAYIDLLNEFFETTSTLVDENGGEVLKFIGDAVLAVFPAGDDPTEAQKNAIQAARSIVQTLKTLREEDGHDCECAIGISFGRVTYGNVGSRERLDFTVIGQAANIAARLGDYGKTRDLSVVVSGNALCDGIGSTDLGELRLHNVSDPVRAWALTQD